MLTLVVKGEDSTHTLHETAVLLANHMASLTDAALRIVRDDELDGITSTGNLILLGGSTWNRFAAARTVGLRSQVSVPATCSSESLGCSSPAHFALPCSQPWLDNATALFVAPIFAQQPVGTIERLALVIDGPSASAIRDMAIAFASPTIPPMARAPFSNLVPDYVITDSIGKIHIHGLAGVDCAGHWGRDWSFVGEASYCTCK
jgi:hypothetical protein